MKRILFLTLAAAFLTSCERPTAPATHDPPAFALTAASNTTFSGDATVLRATVLGLPIVLARQALCQKVEEPRNTHCCRSAETRPADSSRPRLSTRPSWPRQQQQRRGVRCEREPDGGGQYVQADLLRSQAQATCDGTGQASVSGSSEVAGLVINGQAITVSGQPNQRVTCRAC